MWLARPSIVRNRLLWLGHRLSGIARNTPESCDGLDNNCDTLVDNVGFGVGITWRIDCPGGDNSVLYACTMPTVKPGCTVTAE
ncbi:MAG: hypothetical protein RLZZ450_3284 [Pseudomonadota bacterium]